MSEVRYCCDVGMADIGGVRNDGGIRGRVADNADTLSLKIVGLGSFATLIGVSYVYLDI
jgi:hypothetical protein